MKFRVYEEVPGHPYVLLVEGSGWEDLMSYTPGSCQHPYFSTNFSNEKDISVLPVDHSVRGSMKNAANCDK